jgi:hypothetical protein
MEGSPMQSHPKPQEFLRARPDECAFVLPGGYVDEAGVAHRDVILEPLTGRDQAYLASLPPATPSAAVVTQLLARSIRRIGTVPSVDAALVRCMLVGDREFLILKLRQMTKGSKLHITLRCTSDACGKDMEISLALDSIPIEERAVEGRIFTHKLDGANRIEFRLPTGEDQEELAGRADHAAAVSELLTRCTVAVPPALTYAEAAPLVEDAIERAAPRVDLEVEARCPECGHVLTTALDVAWLALSDLAGDPGDIWHDVHVLAWNYHWPESEILALTPKARRRYIDLITQELERTGS